MGRFRYDRKTNYRYTQSREWVGRVARNHHKKRNSNNYEKDSSENSSVHLHTLAEQGHDEAQFFLALMHLGYAEGVPQDFEEASRFFRLAAQQEDADGQCGLGEMYYGGEGVPQDYAEAIKLWKLAAEQGHERAQYNLDNYA